MRAALLPLLVVLCSSAGCLTAARKVEQSIRRGINEPGENRPSGRQLPTADELPATANADFEVRTAHPRLFVASDWPSPTDDRAREWQETLRERADKSIGKPAIAYSANKLLGRSREALKRLSLFGCVYRFTKDAKYAEAGRQELLNVCGFADWQPGDFLATAEMMNAVAIGYDWLYETLSPEDRRTVVTAIADLGLKPAARYYATRSGWTKAQHNWSLVCNGGVIVASLAVMDQQPALARRTLGEAMSAIRWGLSAYDKAGGTMEGPMYHSYATRYLAFATAALKSAPARPVTLTNSPNWLKAGDYRLAMTGPTGKSANFGDCSETLGNTAWMFWLARETGDKRYAAFETRVDSGDPSAFDLLWYQPTDPNTLRSLPGPKKFGSAVVLRPPGDDPLSPFVGVRTGNTSDHHSHLDLGNFVLDLQGQRFAHDLGSDNYDLPGYLGPRRADYLRSNTPGHNTLTVGESSQPADAQADTEITGDKAGKQGVKIDLTEAYPGFKSVTRSFTLDGQTVTVRDEVHATRSATLIWHLHTPARVTIDGDTAVLDVDGKRVEMKVISPENAKLTAEPDRAEPPQDPIENSTHIRVRVKASDKEKIEVRFRPLAE